MDIEAGMKVKIIKDAIAPHYVGLIGRVGKNDNGSIKVTAAGDFWWYGEEDLEVVEEETYNFEVTINTIVSLPTPMSVNYINPDTVVVWDDGDVTRVKCKEGEKWDEYIGFLACLAKKVYGGHNQYKKFIKNAVQNK